MGEAAIEFETETFTLIVDDEMSSIEVTGQTIKRKLPKKSIERVKIVTGAELKSEIMAERGFEGLTQEAFNEIVKDRIIKQMETSGRESVEVLFWVSPQPFEKRIKLHRRVSRKRYIKLLMGIMGYSRNHAEYVARRVREYRPYYTDCPTHTMRYRVTSKGV